MRLLYFVYTTDTWIGVSSCSPKRTKADDRFWNRKDLYVLVVVVVFFFLYYMKQTDSMLREMKLIWTAGIQMKWRCNHRSCTCNLSNLKIEPEKICRASTVFEPMASSVQCSTNWAMKTHMFGADQIIESIFTCDRNETWNEVDLNCGNTERYCLKPNIRQLRAIMCILCYVHLALNRYVWDPPQSHLHPDRL